MAQIAGFALSCREESISGSRIGERFLAMHDCGEEAMSASQHCDQQEPSMRRFLWRSRARWTQRVLQ